MRAVNIAELKNSLNKYVRYARAGEEVITRDRSLPVAKIVPFVADDSDPEEAELIALGIRASASELPFRTALSISVARADSLRLAVALSWCRRRPLRRRFVSSDIRLCEVASMASHPRQGSQSCNRATMG